MTKQFQNIPLPNAIRISAKRVFAHFGVKCRTIWEKIELFILTTIS